MGAGCAGPPTFSAPSLPTLRLRRAVAPRRLLLPPGPQEEGPVQQRAAAGAGEGVREQQVHHPRQEEEDLGRHQPLGAADHHLVPEQAGEREKSRRQSQKQQQQQHPVRTRTPQATKGSPSAPQPAIPAGGYGTVTGWSEESRGGLSRPHRPGSAERWAPLPLLPGGLVGTPESGAPAEGAPSPPALHAEDPVQFAFALQRRCHRVPSL